MFLGETVMIRKGLLVLLLLSLCSSAFSQTQPNGAIEKGPGKNRVPTISIDQRVEKFSQAMGGLTAAQKKKVATYTQEHFKKLEALAKNKSVKDEERQAKRKGYERAYHAKVRAVLTKPQQAKWDKILADRAKKSNLRSGFGGTAPRAVPEKP